MKSFIFLFLSWWSWLLTFTSGFANITTILLMANTSTHHTGTVSKLAIALVEGRISEIITLLMLLLFFFLGAALSGILFHEQTLRPQKKYGVLLISLGILLLFVHMLFEDTVVLYTISFLSGAQNAMFLYIHNFIARTTHLTGYLTDTAFAVGRLIRGYKEDRRKFFFNLSHILVYLLGGILSVVLHKTIPNHLISLIAFLYILAGLIYFIVRRNHLFSFSFLHRADDKSE